jgi:hypothetical protein
MFRLRRFTSLAIESNDSEETIASTDRLVIGEGTLSALVFRQSIPASRSARLQLASRMARGLRAVVVKRRVRERKPMVPVTT